MRVQDGPGRPTTHDLEVEQCLCRGPERGAADDFSPFIDLEHVRWSNLSLVLCTGRDCEPERTTPQDGAEVAARSENPGAVVIASAQCGDLARGRDEGQLRHTD